MSLKQFLSTPDVISFQEVIQYIDEHYHFTPIGFQNGQVFNEPNQNNGSCKLFQFALLHHLSPQDTLHLFGAYYRDDVLGNPSGSDHQNIRNFTVYGWEGIQFEKITLIKK